MYKQDLGLNYRQGLIYHKINQQTNYLFFPSYWCIVSLALVRRQVLEKETLNLNQLYYA